MPYNYVLPNVVRHSISDLDPSSSVVSTCRADMVDSSEHSTSMDHSGIQADPPPLRLPLIPPPAPSSDPHPFTCIWRIEGPSGGSTSGPAQEEDPAAAAARPLPPTESAAPPPAGAIAAAASETR